MQSVQRSPVRITLLVWAVSAYIHGNLMNWRASSARTGKEHPMFKALFAKRRRTYQWKPAIDTSNPRIAASLTTFPTN